MLERIRDLCKARGTSLATLEKELGFSNKSMFAWDRHTPSIDKVKAVADYFDVSIDYLTGNDGADDEWTEYKQQLMESPNTRLLLDTVKDVSPETLLQIAKIAETLKNG